MQFEKWRAKIYALLFILSSLLLSSWSLDASRATAQELAVSSTLSRHNRYTAPISQPKISWEVDVNFIGTQIHAEWILRATDENLYAPIVVEEYVFDLQCTSHGNVQINGNKAHFNSTTQDYITCDMPSYRDLAEEYFGVQVGLVCNCIEPWVAAKARVTPTAQNEYPLLYLGEKGSAYLEAQIERKGKSRASLKTNMNQWARPAWSKRFKIGKSQVLWAGENPLGFIHTLTQRHALYSNDWINFWYAKSTIAGSGSQSMEAYTHITPSGDRWHSWVRSVSGRSRKAQNTAMPTESMNLYIGYNPTTGQYFNGKMWNVGIDPACIGSG